MTRNISFSSSYYILLTLVVRPWHQRLHVRWNKVNGLKGPPNICKSGPGGSLHLYSGNLSRCIFCLQDVTFFNFGGCTNVDYDHFLHSNTCFNWLPWSFMSAGLGKTKFWTRHLRLSTRKLPLNMGTWNYLNFQTGFGLETDTEKM